MNKSILILSLIALISNADVLKAGSNNDSALFKIKASSNKHLRTVDTVQFELTNHATKDLNVVSGNVRYKLYRHDSLILDNGLVLMNLFCPNMEVVSKAICVHRLRANAADTIEACFFKELNALDRKGATTMELYIEFKVFYDEMGKAKDILYFIDTLKVVYTL